MFCRRYSALFAVVTALAHGQQNVTVVAVDPADRLAGSSVLGEWATAGNLDGWTGSNVTSLAAAGGFLTGNDNSASLDATLSRTAIAGGPDLDLGFNDYLQLRIKLPAAYAGDVKIEYGTTANTGFATTRVFVLPAASIPKDGAFHTYRLDMGLEVFWRDSLSDLRITPLVTATGHFEIDYLEVGDVAGTAPALNLATNFLAPLTAATTTRLIGKHVCVWWDSASTTFTTTHARRAVRMCEESYQVYCNKLGYNEPFREFDSTTTPRYKINFITWYSGYWAGGYKNRGHMNIDASGLNNEGWGNPAPHEFGHVVQMAQAGSLVGGHWESHANYLRAGRNLHFYAAIPGCIPGIDNRTGNSNYRPDHKRHIYADQRYYLSLDDYGTQFGLPTNYAAVMWRDGAADQTLVDKLASALPGGISVKDVACECLKRWPMLDFVEKTRIRSQHWGTTANRASHFWNQGAQLIPQQDKPGWWRVPLERAPDRWAYQMHDLTASAGATITVEFRGLDMPGTGEDWRWCLAAISAGDVVRYSPVRAPGTQSFALTASETQVFLIVTATPDTTALDLDSQSNTKPVDKDAARLRYAYEVRLVNATPAAHQYSVDNPAGYHTHGNGGGIVGPSATVDATAYIGPNAKVVGSARVLGTSRVEDYAVIQGSATVQGSAVVSGSALIEGSALVEGSARVRDRAYLTNGAAVRGRALICGYTNIENTTVTDDAVVRGCAYPFGSGTISGTAIMDHDYSMGWSVSNGVQFSHIPWGGWWDAFYAQTLRKPRGLIASYRTQEADGEQWWDEFGALHAQLRGSPLRTTDATMGSAVLVCDGSNDYAALDRSVADTPLFSFSGWIKPGNASGTVEPLVFLGSSATKAMKLVRNATGQAVFTISDGSTTRTLTSTSVLPANEWRNVAVTLDGTSGKLYIGGVAEATAAITLTPLAVLAANNGTAQQANYIGRDWAGGLFKGSFEDMRFYNVAMTAAEVRAEAARHGDLIGQFSPTAATDFNGTTTTAESGVRNGRIRTLSAWVKPHTSDDVSNYEAIFDSDDERSGLQGSGIGLDAGKWVARLDNVGNWATNVSATLGQWQHVALAFNGSTATLFINGAQAATRSYSGPGYDAAAAGKCYRIGFSQTAEDTATRQFFDGLILNARVHDRALTAAQIVLDSDGDGVNDNVEADAGSNPLDAQSLPAMPTATSIASGDWHTTTTWDKLQVPGAETLVMVNNDRDITITTAAANCSTLTLGGGASVSASGRSLTVANPTINALDTTGGTLALNATATLNIAKTNTSAGLAGLTVASGTVLNITGELTVDSGKNLSGATLNTPKVILAGGTLTKSDGLGIGSGGLICGSGTITGTVTVAGGGTLSPGTDTSIDTIVTNGLTLAAGSLLTINASAAGNDRITVGTSGGLTLNGGVISLYNDGSTTTFSTPGTYNLIAYSGSIGGAVSNLSVANKVAGRKYAFGTAGGFVTLTIAQGAYWNGGGTNALWSNAANWSGASPASGDILTYATAGAGGATLNNNISGGSFASLQFESGAPAFTLNGNAITLTGDLAGNVVLNNSSNTQTVNLPITLTGAANLNAASGAIVIGNACAIANAGFGLTIMGPNAVTLSGAFSGGGGVIRSSDAGTLNINSATALGSGRFTINGGTLDNTSTGAVTLSTAPPQTWAGDFTFTGTQNLNLGTGAVTLGTNRQVTVNGSKTLTIGGAITGAGLALTKTGTTTGTLVVSSVGSNFGTLTVSGGVLRLDNSLAASPTMTVTGCTVNTNSALLDINNTTLTTAGINVQRGQVVVRGASVINNSGGNIRGSGNSRSMSYYFKENAVINSTPNDLQTSYTEAAQSYYIMMQDSAQATFANVILGQNAEYADASGHNTVLEVRDAAKLTANSDMYVMKTNRDAGRTQIMRVHMQVYQHGGTVTVGGNLRLHDNDSAKSSTSPVHETDGAYNLWTGGSLKVGGYISGGKTRTGVGQAYFNFHGGTLAYTGAGTQSDWINLTASAITDGIDSSQNLRVWEGATIDTGSQNVTVAQALLRPTGQGVSAIAIDGLTGTAYTNGCPPWVFITRDTASGDTTGAGASAVATLNASGNITGFIITNPGNNYTAKPLITLIRGDTGATGTAVPAANITLAANSTYTGGLTKKGAGTLTLTGSNTYTGPTAVEAGTLALSGASGSISNTSRISIAAGATMDVSLKTSPYILSTSTALGARGAASPATFKGAPGGTLNLGSQALALTWGGASSGSDSTHPSLTISQAALVLANNTFTVVTGTPLNAGVYTLVAAPAGISGTVNATPSYAGGSGVASGVSGVISISGNTVILTVQANQTAFEAWAGKPAFGLAAGDRGADKDPDGDGQNNLLEFALDGTPSNGSNNAKVFSSTGPAPAGYGFAGNVLILTIAVRNNAGAFTGPAPYAAVDALDGIRYTIQGGANLNDWGGTVYPFIAASYPGLPAPGTDYHYQSFALTGSQGLPGKGFMRVKVEPLP